MGMGLQLSKRREELVCWRWGLMSWQRIILSCSNRWQILKIVTSYISPYYTSIVRQWLRHVWSGINRTNLRQSWTTHSPLMIQKPTSARIRVPTSWFNRTSRGEECVLWKNLARRCRWRSQNPSPHTERSLFSLACSLLLLTLLFRASQNKYRYHENCRESCGSFAVQLGGRRLCWRPEDDDHHNHPSPCFFHSSLLWTQASRRRHSGDSVWKSAVIWSKCRGHDGRFRCSIEWRCGFRRCQETRILDVSSSRWKKSCQYHYDSRSGDHPSSSIFGRHWSSDQFCQANSSSDRHSSWSNEIDWRRRSRVSRRMVSSRVCVLWTIGLTNKIDLTSCVFQS